MIALSTHGRPLNLKRPIVARISRSDEENLEDPSRCALISENSSGPWKFRYRAVLSSSTFEESELPPDLPCIHSIGRLTHLKSGDVVVLHPRSGLVRTLFRPDSNYNSLLLTDRCNSFCLMCSQPPVDKDDSELVDINLEAIRLMDPPPETLGLTGGEPTLLGEDLFRIIRELRDRLPNTDVHMLTNGRRFAWTEFTAAFMSIAHPRLTLGVPVYADNAADHDYVVQTRGAFDQTIQGLHQLARYDQAIEIRVVLHALTVPRLKQLAEYIYRNVPFASHVAFMGLEITGFAKPNLSKLWIDPYDYQLELAAAVEHLAIRGMSVSIYNHQLCLLNRELWPFARKAISDWKNVYLECCEPCRVRSQCGGFFQTGLTRVSSHLAPI
jgi:His-Xaa-Ser system radical SAM maturase HxsC